MPSTATLALVDGVQIVVPNSLNLITPYVLLEQQDWFEDEIKFLRRLLQPGNKVIDIGANYGVYTLSMARTVGPSGHVWAFEPASSTAQLLSEGIAINEFPQVTLNQSALSSTCGTAQLSLNDNSELNALIRNNPSTNESETVPLITLDECLHSYSWRDIDFMKIDAEGEESNILKGGTRFFSELSPLVQYEIKAGAELNLQLVQEFAALGYDSYRLVPGLDLLIPFDSESTPDEYLLNLFCCKQDRAEQLGRSGFLVNSAPHTQAKNKEPLKDIWANPCNNRNTYDWHNTIGKLPYGAQLANAWEQTMTAGNSAEVHEALSLYAFSQDPSQSPAERLGALKTSFRLLSLLNKHQPSHLRQASLARVAQDYGARSIAVAALAHLSNTILQNQQTNVSEPFLTPGKRFDTISPDETIGEWVLASVLEGYERLASFSSFYTGISARDRLELIHALGFGSPEMERRLHLLNLRFGPPTS